MLGSSVEHTETSRAPASAFLLIDSQDRYQTSTVEAFYDNWFQSADQPLNDFTIFKRQPFLSGYFHRIAVAEVRFEYCSPNINIRNNKIKFLDSAAAEHDIEVPQGFYTPSELADALELELDDAIPGQTWTVSYENSHFKIVSDEEFQILPFDYDDPQQIVKGLYFMMNWNINNTAPDTSQIAMDFPSLTYTKYIDICSRQLTQYQKVKDNSTRENQTPAVLCRLYLGNYTSEGLPVSSGQETTWPGARPCVIQRIMNVPKYSMWNPGQFIDQIDIQLRDDAGNLLFIPYNAVGETNAGTELGGARTNQCSFQLTLHCSES
jgi:hypothetical protein